MLPNVFFFKDLMKAVFFHQVTDGSVASTRPSRAAQPSKPRSVFALTTFALNFVPEVDSLRNPVLLEGMFDF